MIDFIICDDNKHVREINHQIVSKATISYDFNYKVHSFSRYNNELKNVINNTSSIKIYLLDIEMSGKSGIEIAKEIRKVDWDSVIIILTSHEELELKVLKQKLLILDFVSKFDDYESKIIEAIELVLNKFSNNDDKIITFKSHHELYHVKLNSILYIFKNSYNQTSVIVTDDDKYEVSEPLYKLASKLSKNFIQTHKSCYVNKKRIKHIDISKRTIVLENGVSIDYLSRTYKKNLEGVIK